MNDALAAKEMVFPADRAYVDFENLYRWHTGKSLFVVRLKKSVKFKRLNDRELPEDRHQHILIDEYIELSEGETKAKSSDFLWFVFGSFWVNFSNHT